MPRSLTKDQLHDLWEALRKNDVRGLQKFEEFLGKVSGEIRRAKMDSEQLESALKRYESHLYGEKLYYIYFDNLLNVS